MLKNKTSLLFLGFLFVFGCSPYGETVLKKDDIKKELADLPKSPTVSQVVPPESPLDLETRSIIRSYGSTIKKYSIAYGFDWRLVLAIMKQESGFSPAAESQKGALGLMQIMPATSDEVARVLDIADMTHPRNNIRGGIFYLKRLYDLFDGAEGADRIRLTLAAYNAGPGRIYDAQEIAAYLHDNPAQWLSIKGALPLLSKRYYTLHKNVWQDQRPRTGWFGNSGQTLAYVENIMNYYDEYRLVLD